MIWLFALSMMAPLEKVTYAAGYIPNVQFAPFYVAKSKGYYEAEGIELEMDYTIGTDVFKLVALNKVHFGSADSDAFLHAVGRDLPLVHIATLYRGYPIALIAREPILDHERLSGKRIGISGTYGSSYLGLKAILAQLDLSLGKVKPVSIGFTQVAALQQGKVDAVVGYINNEPVRLRAKGVAVHALGLDAKNLIPGVGIMTSRELYKRNPELAAGFLRATFKGLHDVLQDPQGCYEIVVNDYLPELKTGENYDIELQILRATLPFWTDAAVDGKGYGQVSEVSWERLVNLLEKNNNGDVYKSWRNWVDMKFTYQPEEKAK